MPDHNPGIFWQPAFHEKEDEFSEKFYRNFCMLPITTGEAFLLTVGAFLLADEFFAYSPLMPLLEALSL